MKTRHVITLVLRMIGLLLGLYILAFIPSILWVVLNPPPVKEFAIGFSPIPQLTGFILGLLPAYILFFHGERLARYIVQEDEYIEMANITSESADTTSIFRLFLRVVGAFTIAFAIPELAGHSFSRIMIYHTYDQQIWLQIIPGIIKLAIGIYFLKGGSLVVNWAYSSSRSK